MSIEFSHEDRKLLRIPDCYDAKIAENLQPLDILPCNSTNKLSFQNPKDGLLAELQAKMSRGWTFLLFWHHRYQVSLKGDFY